MTDNNNPLPTKNEDIKQDKFSLKDDKENEKILKKPDYALRALILLMLFITGIGTGIYFLPILKDRLPIIAEWIEENDNTVYTQLNEKVAEQQSAINQLTRQTADQEKRLNQFSTTPKKTLSSDLEDRLSALEESFPIEHDDTAAIIDTSQSNRMDMLLSRMSQLEASFIPLSKNMIDAAKSEKEREALQEKNLSLNEKIALLESRIGSLETQAARDNTGLLLNKKIAELKKKVVSGEFYKKELDTLRIIIDSGTMKTNTAMSNALDKLENFASTGLVTPDQLKRSFSDFIPDLIKANNLDASASWWQNTLNKIQNMITIRNTDAQSDVNKTMDGLIAEIESWLDTADLKSSLQLVETMPDALQQLLTNWKTDVENWLHGEEAIETLESIAAESYLVLRNNNEIRNVT
jgi:hypothetical protein